MNIEFRWMDERDLGVTIAERSSVQKMPCAALNNQQEHSPRVCVTPVLVSREVRHSIPHLSHLST